MVDSEPRLARLGADQVRRQTILVWLRGFEFDRPYSESDAAWGTRLLDQLDPERVADKAAGVFYTDHPNRERIRAALLGFYQTVKLITN